MPQLLPFFLPKSPQNSEISEKIEKNGENYNEYIKKFWVGLMDGDGSIQVNHWRTQSLQYRLIIKLKNTTSNYNMLIEIAKVIGGTVRINSINNSVIWVVDNRDIIKEIIKIFDKYPPLTSRKICQLKFLKNCLQKNSIEWYFNNRNSKYLNQLTIIRSDIFGLEKGNLNLPPYFKGWFSGFVEAEGCFSIRKNNNHSFSIGQNDDIYLLNVIKEYLNATNIVINPYANFYSLEIYKKEILNTIFDHFHNFPLLGEKLNSFNEFKQKF
jgi:LAGLIDADG endonuclease